MRFLRSKRFWKRVGLGFVFLVAVGLIVNAVAAWQMESRLQSRLQAIRAAGDPATIADLAPPPIPDAENAAVILERIQPRLSEFSHEYAQFYESPLGENYEELQDRGEPGTAEQIAAIRAILTKYQDVEQALVAAAKCEKYGSRLDYSLDCSDFIRQMVNTQGLIRGAAGFVHWQMEVLLAEHHNDKAIEQGLMVLRLARLYESEPSIVPTLVAIAIRGLIAGQIYEAFASGPVSPDVAGRVNEELAKVGDPQRLVHALKSDRAVSGSWSGQILDEPFPVLPRLLSSVMKSNQVGVIDLANEYVQLASRPWYEIREQFGEADSPVPSTGYGAMADMLCPALRAVFQANARSIALSRALAVYIALREFKEKNGREATGLVELALPKEATTDPFTGQPLKLKWTDDGWIVYSVMNNGADDGGDFKGLKDYGVAPAKYRGTE